MALIGVRRALIKPKRVVSGGGGVTGWASLIPQSGLVSAWPFDSTYTTSSAATDPINGSNLTLTSASLNGSGPSANLNNSVAFNGSTSRGDKTSGPSTKTLLTSSAWSLVAWLKASTTTNGPRIIANDHADSDNNGFQFMQTGTPAVSGNVGNGSTNAAVVSNSLMLNAWTMVAFVFSGGTITTYIGGTAGPTGSFTGPVTAGSNEIGFGYNPAYSGDFWTGSMAGVAIYSRALTSGEVSTISGL